MRHLASPARLRSNGHLIGADIANLQTEVGGLENLQRQLFLEHVDKNASIDRMAFSKTPLGIYYNLLGYCLSIYCVYKLVMVRAVFACGWKR